MTSTEPEGATTSTDVPENVAAAIASQIQGVSKPRVRRLADIMDDEQAGAAPPIVEFVHSKAAKKAKREWKAEQEDQGSLPKPPPKRSSPFLTIIIILCSTLSAVLFGYRMYVKHYGPMRNKYLLYTKEQLAKHDGNHRVPWIAIVGEIYDVSKAKNYYGKEGGYSFFSGVDASRAYLTGEFATDLNDNVTDFSNSQFAGLVHWKDFYLKEYKYVGRVVGAFFSEYGKPTALHQRVMEGTLQHKAAEKERKNKRLAYPNCSSRWSSKAGSEVWCEDDQYPRLLTEMVSGRAEQRCACFEQKGWSNLRKVYPGCEPFAHRCKLIVKEPAPVEGDDSIDTKQAEASAGQASAGQASESDTKDEL